MKPLIPFKTVISGEIQGGTIVPTRLPNIPCSMVKIKAMIGNGGNVYLGGENVTVPNGTTDQTSGYPLDEGDVLDWIPIDNLNKLYLICDNNGDDIVYIAFR